MTPPNFRKKHLKFLLSMLEKSKRLRQTVEDFIPEQIILETLASQYCKTCDNYELSRREQCNHPDCIIVKFRYIVGTITDGLEGYPVELEEYLKANLEKFLQGERAEITKKIMEKYREAMECESC